MPETGVGRVFILRWSREDKVSINKVITGVDWDARSHCREGDGLVIGGYFIVGSRLVFGSFECTPRLFYGVVALGSVVGGEVGFVRGLG
jgi:hypothetical protein